MKNYVKSGDVLALTAPYARLSGEGALIGTLFGVAMSDVANGAVGEFAITGVMDIAALSTDTASEGAALYWDNTNKRLTTTSSGNTKVGVAVKAKLAAETTARIRLNAAF
jgi:predicted RecA/RadA family phage recombinase